VNETAKKRTMVIVDLPSLEVLMSASLTPSQRNIEPELAIAYHRLQSDIQSAPVIFGCQHAQESGFICHECGKIV